MIQLLRQVYISLPGQNVNETAGSERPLTLTFVFVKDRLWLASCIHRVGRPGLSCNPGAQNIVPYLVQPKTVARKNRKEEKEMKKSRHPGKDRVWGWHESKKRGVA